VQFLANFVEYIALAGLALLGVDYQQGAACQVSDAEFSTVEYIAIDGAGVDEQAIWLEQDFSTAIQARSCDANMVPEMISESASQTIFIQT